MLKKEGKRAAVANPPGLSARSPAPCSTGGLQKGLRWGEEIGRWLARRASADLSIFFPEIRELARL